MKEFDKLVELHEDFSIIWAEVKIVRREAEDMISAVQARLHNERKRNEERISELQQTMSDPSRTESVRRVARAELARIRDCKYHANAAEIDAFKELIEQEKKALRDLRKMQQSARAAIDGAKTRIEEIRKDILGDQIVDLAFAWPESQDSEFAKLCAEVRK